eukprot:CAMPEP_0197044122 /NCGR_PEP_ID=MMETSP1384-20130603/20230_1 /TAXON_ID=29189 /ORGANISM="Ammonia sp." /LENGTH=314 /DNA_ID=CAMNT_0042475519 /DNA_START=35 /DNA_END=979 /DNA_ORIENTATION=-
MGSRSSTLSSARGKSNRFCKNENRDQFLINYMHGAQTSDVTQQLDQRRLVFISLLGLFCTWKKCPPYLLYSALLIMPLKSKWIYRPRKYEQEIQSSLLAQLSVFGDKHRVAEFLELLKWKDSQQLVVWTLDEDNFSTDYRAAADKREPANLEQQDAPSDPLIAPFWKYVSRKLTSLVDPITGNNYMPLKDTKWWHSSYRHQTDKCVDDVPVKSILVEMYFVTLKYKAVSELIYQSNPASLFPVVSYSDSVATPKTMLTSKLASVSGSVRTQNGGEHDEEQDVEEEDGWWISPDYDPYDLDEQLTDADNDELSSS